MLVTPRGDEIVAVVRVLLLVEIDDLVDRPAIAIGFDEHRVRRERDALRLEDHVVRDFARGLQILRQQRRRHRERLARIVEARLVRRIDGELARGLQILAGEIANGVVVLGVAQSPRQHKAGIAGVAPRFGLPHRVDPGDHGLALFGSRLRRRRRRRHLPGRAACRARRAQCSWSFTTAAIVVYGRRSNCAASPFSP